MWKSSSGSGCLAGLCQLGEPTPAQSHHGAASHRQACGCPPGRGTNEVGQRHELPGVRSTLEQAGSSLGSREEHSLLWAGEQSHHFCPRLLRAGTSEMWSPHSWRATCTPNQLVNAAEPGEPAKSSVRAGHLAGHVEKSLGLRLSLHGQGPHPTPSSTHLSPASPQPQTSTAEHFSKAKEVFPEKS